MWVLNQHRIEFDRVKIHNAHHMSAISTAGGSMTLEKVITSHSDRALAVQGRKVANQLANSAAQTAHLLRILSKGKRPDDVASLTRIADDFVQQASKYTHGSEAKLKFTHLIPYSIWDGATADDAEMADLAEGLRSLLDTARNGDIDDQGYQVDLKEKMETLIRLSRKFDGVARSAGKTSIFA